MALDATPTIREQGGKASSDPLRAIEVEFNGDGAYPTGGTPNFQDYVRNTILGREDVTLVALIDHSVGANRAIYDTENDKLFIEVKSTGVERSAADDSGNAYQCTLICK